jgi:acyl carrier protein
LSVVEQPTTVAPGHGPDPMQQSHGLPPDVDLQAERDIDSMDFLNFLIALGEYTGVHVPESDYAQVRTLGGCTAYLAARSMSRTNEHRSRAGALVPTSQPDRDGWPSFRPW